MSADDQANYRVRGPFPLSNKADQLAVEADYPLPTEEEQLQIIEFLRKVLRYAKFWPLYRDTMTVLVYKHLNRPYGENDVPNVNTWYTSLHYRVARNQDNEQSNLRDALGRISVLMGSFQSRRERNEKLVDKWVVQFEKGLAQIEQLTGLVDPADCRKAVNRLKKEKRLTANVRMMESLANNPKAVEGFTAEQWANYLGVAKSTIIGTVTWKGLSAARRDSVLARRKDRHRKTRPN